MNLSCNVVRDLLPTYIEHLTCDDTSHEVEEHLETCEECRTVMEEMESELCLKKAPKPKTDFFKKLRSRQIIGAVLSVVITLFCLYWLYSQEYWVDVSSTVSLEAAINEKNAPTKRGENIEANVLETRKIGNRLFVLYEDVNNELNRGLMQLRPGIFGKYNVKSNIVSDWPLYQHNNVKVGGQWYMIVWCVNDLPDVERYRVYEYAPEGYEPALIHEGEAAPVMFEFVPITEEQHEKRGFNSDIEYLDADGNIIESRDLLDNFGVNGGGGGGGGGSLSTMFVFMAITLMLGIVFVRYFLKP